MSSEAAIQIIQPAAIETFTAGPGGTICVNPALFQELVSFNDAITLGWYAFLLGVLFGAGLILLRLHIESKEQEENEDGA